MPAALDLTGQRFGRWTVIGKAPNRGIKTMWHCKCDCGNEKDVPTQTLRRGESKSCGCLSRELASERGKLNKEKYIKDLTGQIFGDLTVISLSNERRFNHACWNCKCVCGNEIVVEQNRLVSHRKTNCGCKQIISQGEFLITKLLQDNNIPFEAQKTFKTCKYPDTNVVARFDFYVNDSYIIEFDGSQHFKFSNKGWMTEEKFKYTQEHDSFKNQWCKDNNIPLIRIPYTHLKDLCLEDLLLETSKYIVQ